MQLRSARLCLDCEELHEEPQCPACASEAFVYLTRWIPVDDRRTRKRKVPRSAPPPARMSTFVKGGAVGLAMLATARWLLRSQTQDAGSASNGPTAPSDAGDPSNEQDETLFSE